MSDFNKNKNFIRNLNFLKKKIDVIYQNSSQALISWNKQGEIIDINQKALNLFKWSREEILNKDFIKTIIAESDREIWVNWKSGVIESFPRDFMSCALRSDNSLINCIWNNTVIKENNRIIEIISAAKDLSKESKKDVEIVKLVKAINETDNWVVITNKKGVIEYANTTVKQITGYSKEEVIGKDPSLFKSGKHPNEFYQQMWHKIKTGQVFNDVIINKKKNGEYFYSEQTITPIKDQNENIINYISVGRDITQNKKLRSKIEYISNYDILFGLPNRRAFINKINSLIEIHTEKKLSVLAINIKGIKYLNDIYNDPKSNETLINIAADLINGQLISENKCVKIADNNYLAYLGGENFAVIVDKIDFVNDIYKIAEELLSIFNDPITYNGESFMLAARIGISVYPDDCITSQNLLSNAEIALINISKADYAFFDQEMNQKIKDFTTMEAGLNQAIKNDDFLIYYQPYYDGVEQELVGMEALIRWNDPQTGIISPAKFIPVLEESQLIKKVGLIVVRKVVRVLKNWLDNDFSVVPISINLSAKQLEDKSHLQEIFRIINKSGVDNSLIRFEITESIAMDNVNYSLEIMREMKNRGFAIAIDDFGTGYSSFSYLQKFPIDYLKIDISFIRNMTLSNEGKKIVESIINIAHLLNLKTIAEGVEEDLEVEELNNLKNDYIQGYYFSYPKPEVEIEKIYNLK